MNAEMFLTKRAKAMCKMAKITAKEYLLGRKAALEDEANEIEAAAEKATEAKPEKTTKKGGKNAGRK